MRLHLTRAVRPIAWTAWVAFTASCSHTDTFTNGPSPLDGALDAAIPTRLTFSPDYDLYPSYSEDGKQIVYTFVLPRRPDRDRCIGIIPAGGGTRTREVCETRVSYEDSTDALVSGALSAAGRLIYSQTTARPSSQVPGFAKVFVVEPGSSAPRLVAATPLLVPGTAVTWLSKLRWIGADEFVALGQLVTLVPRCQGCVLRDTVFTPIAVVRGTITPDGGTLQTIAGSEGAQSYSINSANSVLIIARGTELLHVPVGGGAGVRAATANAPITDVDCRRDLCAVLVGATSLQSVPFAGGALSLLPAAGIGRWSSVSLSPVNGDVVVTNTSASGTDLYLFRGLL